MLVGVAMCLAAGVVLADDSYNEGLFGKTGFYIGGGVGEAKVRASQSDTRPHFNSDDTSWKALVGVSPFPFVSAEASYIDFGNPTDVNSGAKVGIDLTGWTAAVIGHIPLGPINVFAKGGGIRWHTDFTTTGAGFIPHSDSGTDFMWGGGVGLKSDHLGVRAEYERFNIAELDRVNLLSLGVTWTF
jgi:hypothetical protein